jgi:hypothetical protein
MGVWKAYRTSTVRHNHLDVLRTREYAMAHACYASKDDKIQERRADGGGAAGCVSIVGS